MAISFLQQRKFQKTLIFIFLAIILVAAFIIWQGFFKRNREAPSPTSLILPEEEIKIDFGLFKNPLLKELQLFSEIQPFLAATSTETKRGEKLGRENPFLPY